uniref:Uncharacterized protein K0413C07.29 n=1 Tax=Oryza sativa subsp. indica TaxID=39946 RepID=C8TFN8_ORYSI|nr:hypothetical protein [Oryza sativa Indica Group]
MCIEISLEERKGRAASSRDYHVSYTRGQSTRRPHGEDEERAGKGGFSPRARRGKGTTTATTLARRRQTEEGDGDERINDERMAPTIFGLDEEAEDDGLGAADLTTMMMASTSSWGNDDRTEVTTTGRR